MRAYYLPALGLVLLLLLANALLAPAFLDLLNLTRFLFSALPMVFLAAGQTLVVLGGGVDLSLGALLTLASVAMVVLFPHLPAGLVVALGLGLGLLGGLLNGFAVAQLRLQPLVATFATGFLFGGLALWILPQPGGEVPQAFRDLFAPPWVPFLALALLLLAWRAWASSRPGAFLYALGGRAWAAYASGVPVGRVYLMGYALAGLLAGLAALFLLVETGTGDPLVGQPMILGSITAVVLGGTRLSGGSGGVEGSVLGALLLALFRNLVFFLGVPSELQVLAEGVVVLLALAGAGLLAGRARWSS